jgi:ABC-2 type transport system ATP-binding protein
MDGLSLYVQRGAVRITTMPPGGRPFSTPGERAGSTRGLMRGRSRAATIEDMSEPDVVTVRDLRKTYRGRVVVDGLDLDVPAGEVVGLVGANGAGKTTTVECIQGLRRPDAGVLSVLGYDPVTQAKQLRPLVGSQLQDSALPDRLRVGEALDLFATSRARDGGELLEQFGLAERRRSAFSSLSGGERQRLFLVLALLNRPRLVILDELTQGLDPAARRNVWAAVRQLRDAGTTVLLVTHEMDEAEALCGRIVVMRAGRVLDAGTPAELVDRHARRATVRFSMPDPPAPLLDEIRQLESVREVEVTGARVTVHGDRRIIAYVGATLVRWGSVPKDLSAHVPGLEDALLRLIEHEPAVGAPIPAMDELGGPR